MADESKLLFIQILICFTMFNFFHQKKILIANFIKSSDLNISTYQIPTNDIYSITMWIRILSDNQLVSDSTILEIRSKTSNQMIQLISENLALLKIKDENGLYEQTNWPVPYQNGLIDQYEKATLYNKWLPFTLSKDLNDNVYISSYHDLQIKTFQKIINLTNNFYIVFEPQNTNTIDVIFSNVILQNVLIDSAIKINDFIFNNSYLGLYYHSAFSKNKKVFYNLNQQNEFQGNHMYFNDIYNLIYDDIEYVGSYELYIPNFYDQNVYYICQFYQEINYLFQSNFVSFQTNLPKTYILYHRQLSYQTQYFSLFYKFQFNYAQSNNYTIQESGYFDDNGTQNLIKTGTFQKNNQGFNFYTNRSFVINMYSYPQSNFLRYNKVEVGLIWYEFQQFLQYQVNYIYSYYDQILQKCEDNNDMIHIIAHQIYKIIFYRSVYYTDTFDGTYNKHTFGRLNQIYLKKISQSQNYQTINFNPNSMTEIIEGTGIQDPGYNNLCKDVSPNCVFCINLSCVQCHIDYYLSNGVCLYCRSTFFQFVNGCYNQTQLFSSSPIINGIQHDSLIQKIIGIDLDIRSKRDTSYLYFIFRKIILESTQQAQTLQYQMQNFYQNYDYVRIYNFRSYYLDGFSPETKGICKTNKVFQIDSQFYTICKDQCEQQQHVQQNKICTQNFDGCQIQDQIGCQKCLSNYIQTSSNGKILCSQKQINNQKVYYILIKQSTTQTISNCYQGTSDLKCVDCNINYMLNKLNQQCLGETAEYIKIRNYSTCTKYDDPNSPNNCIGVTSNQYITNTESSKWKNKCNINNSYMMTCSSCTQSNFYLSTLKNCYQCDVYDSNANKCLQCPSGYQQHYQECAEPVCKDLITNCLECSQENLSLCSSCNSGYYLVKKNDYFECKFISDCQTEVYDANSYTLTCQQCNDTFALIDENLQINSNGIYCISQTKYLDNCIEYQIVNSQYECTKCDSSFMMISQYFCLGTENFVTDCGNYDLITQECKNCIDTSYQCLDQNLKSVLQNCKFCIKNYLLIQNCLQSTGSLDCILCETNYTCIDFNYSVSNTQCDFCKDNNTTTQNCQQFDSNFTCITCAQNFFCLDSAYLVSQTPCQYCVDSSKQIQNCQQYDQNYVCQLCQEGFQCLDLNRNVSTQECKFCEDSSQLTPNCYNYDSNMQCQVCQQNFECIDQNYQQSINNCNYCQEKTNLTTNCFQFDQNFKCTSCQNDYFCLDLNYYISINQCDYCIENIYYIQNCTKYNSDLTCQFCDTNYFNVDNLYKPNQVNTQYCFDQNNFIQYCDQYNSDQKCISCQAEYFCLDLNLRQIEKFCSFCAPDIKQVEQCYQYDHAYECTICQQNHFLHQNKSQTLCIQDLHYVLNCIEYQQQNLEYICILCDGGILPYQNKCIQCSSNEVYVSNQQICIYEQNFINKCFHYDTDQNCSVCEDGYFLVNSKNGENLQQNCFENIIQFCQTYRNNNECIECQQEYVLSIDMKQCISKEDCNPNICLQKEQQQILYSMPIDNCLILVENCQICQKENKNLCSKCKNGYIYKNNSCVTNCNNLLYGTVVDNNIYCAEKNDTSEFSDLCQKIFPNCKQCFYGNNGFYCQQCQEEYQLKYDNCYHNKKDQLMQCELSCLVCSLNECLACQENFIMKDNFCIKQTVEQNDIICQQNVICYKNGNKVNQHCQSCKEQCLIFTKDESIIFDERIKLDLNYKLENIQYISVLDLQNNAIQVKQKNILQSSYLIIQARDIVNESVNCYPQEETVFYFQKIQINNSNKILQNVQDSQQYSSYFALFTGSQSNIALQIIIEEMKLFWHINLLNISGGNIYKDFIYRKKVNIEIQNQKLIEKYISKISFPVNFVIQRDQIDLDFLHQFQQYLLQHFISYIILIGIFSIILLFKFDLNNFKTYLDKIKSSSFQYIFVAATKMFLDILIFSSNYHYYIVNGYWRGFTFLSIIFCIQYSIFWTLYKVLIQYAKTKKLKKRQIQIHERIIQQQQNTQNMVLGRKMIFLFFKLKTLFEFQNNKIMAISLFILLNMLEIHRGECYKDFQYLFKVYILQSLYCVFTIIFFIILIVNQTFKNDMYDIIIDVIFIILLLLQTLIPVFTKIQFFLRRNIANQFIFLTDLLANSMQLQLTFIQLQCQNLSKQKKMTK